MSDLVETHMGEVCDTCGNIGFEGALVTCTQCKVGCEHLYCMRKFGMVVPADWCCEMCRNTNMASSDSGLKKVSCEPVICNLPTELPRYPKEFTDRKKFCKGARGNWNEKAVGKGKTKYLWTNEVKNMPSGEKKGELTLVGPVSSKPSKSGDNMGRMKPKSINHANSSHMVKSNPKFGPSRSSEQLHPTRFGNTQNNTSVQKVKELKSILTPVKEHRQVRQTSFAKDIKTSDANKKKEIGEAASASQMSRRSQTRAIPQTDATLSSAISLTPTEVIKINRHLQKTISKEPCGDCQSPMSGNVIFTVEEFHTKAAAEKPLPTDPAPDASWIGNFILKDEETSISLQAYPTSKGLSKVKDFSKNMPEVLEFELYPYENFLMTVFKGCDPGDEDIGLYFFPDNKIRPNTYISHLEQLSRKYFLRSCIDGFELLVFTSKVLHEDYRKRNNCDFLWGIIYQPRHRKLKGPVEETMVVDMDIDSEDVDMEVDMVGGESIGTVDVVVPKPIESDNDVPPGFTPSMRGQWNDVPPGFTAPIKIKKEVL